MARAGDLGSLFYSLELEIAKFKDGLNKADKLARERSQKMSKAFNTTKRALVGLGSAFAALGVSAFIKNSLDAADKVGKLSQRLGISTEALSQYQHVAKLTGVEFNTMTMAFQRMTRRVAEAAQGTGEAKNALKELGISATELVQLAPDKQFELLADAIQKVQNPADQVRLAMKLFDSEGVALIQTMQGGSESIRAMREEADRLGKTLSKDQVDAAAKAKDEMAKLTSAFEGFAQTIAGEVAGPLATLLSFLTEYIPKGFRLARDATSRFIELVITAFAKAQQAVTDFIETVANFPRKVKEAFSNTVSGIKSGVTELSTSVLDKFKGFTDGVIDNVKGMYEQVVGQSFVPDMIEGIKEQFSLLPDVMVEPAETATFDVVESFSDMQQQITGILSDVLLGVRDFGDALKSLGRKILSEFVESTVGGVVGALFGGGGKSTSGGIGGSIAGSIAGGAIGKFAKGSFGKIAGIFGGGGAAATTALQPIASFAGTKIAGPVGILGAPFLGATSGAGPVAISGITGFGASPTGFAGVQGLLGAQSGAAAAPASGGLLAAAAANPAVAAAIAALAVFGGYQIFGGGRSRAQILADELKEVAASVDQVKAEAPGMFKLFEDTSAEFLGGGFRSQFLEFGTNAAAEAFAKYAETVSSLSVDVQGTFVRLIDEKAKLEDTSTWISGVDDLVKRYDSMREEVTEIFTTLSGDALSQLAVIQLDAENVARVMADGFVSSSESASLGIRGLGDVSADVFRQLVVDVQSSFSEIELNSEKVTDALADNFVTAAELAALGIHGLGGMAADTFRSIVANARAAAEAAQQVGASVGGPTPSLGPLPQISAPPPRQRADFQAALGGAHGLSFLMRGGGVDGTNVRVSGGERVRVETPSQQRATIDLLTQILAVMTKQQRDFNRLVANA